MSRQTHYTSEWENKNEYPEISLWISGKADEKTFCCRICHKKPLQLGNMGIKALRTHGKNIQPYKKKLKLIKVSPLFQNHLKHQHPMTSSSKKH